MTEIRIHGRGGQGAVTLADMIARIALAFKKHSQTMPLFGVERRGAAMRTSVRIADHPIKVHSQSFKPNMVVLMHGNLLQTAQADSKHENAVFVQSGTAPLPVSGPQWYVDAVSIAHKHGLVSSGEPFINFPMLGALCRVLNLPEPLMEEEISDRWTGSVLDANLAAAREAYRSVQYLEGSVSAC